MSPLRTQRGRVAFVASALAVALGSFALASPSRSSPPVLREPARAVLRPRERARSDAPISGTRAAVDSDGGATAPLEPSETLVTMSANAIVDEIRSRFCVPYAAMVCAARIDCGCPEAASSHPRCESDVGGRCVEWANEVWRLAERIDVAAIDECLVGIADRSSACVRDWPRCAPFATSLAREGGRCSGGARDCMDGRCDHTRTCRRYAAPGERCLGGICAPGAICSDDDLCVAPGDAGARCEQERECAWPLTCRDGRCRPRGGEGSTCDDESGCGAGMRCGERERCEVVEQCDGREMDCGRDRTCVGVAEDRCVIEDESAWPVPQLGHRCEWLCADGATCIDGRCAPGPAEGERCDVDRRCGPGLACAHRNGLICVPSAALGEPCDRHGRTLPPCAPDAFCEQETSTCVATAQLGQLCTDALCALGLSCAIVMKDAECVPSICSDE